MADLRKPSACLSGFSIIEVMIVVSLISILAAVSMPAYRGYLMRSKTAEAKTNLGAIRTAETAYFSEFGEYVEAAPEPPTLPGDFSVAFDDVNTAFNTLGFSPEGQVYFSYGVDITADLVGFTADAGADLDADGIVQFWGYARPDASGEKIEGQVGCDASTLGSQQILPCDPAYGRSIF
jgi:prepilin-type N-terminal cleavage/methylation domain-containing protein